MGRHPKSGARNSGGGSALARANLASKPGPNAPEAATPTAKARVPTLIRRPELRAESTRSKISSEQS